MANRGRLKLPTRPPHVLEVGCSQWQHTAYVVLDGRRAQDRLTWEKPGRDWVLDLPGLPEHRLEVQIRCFFDRVHYPHSHVVVARWGEARMAFSSGGSDAESLIRAAQPPFTA